MREIQWDDMVILCCFSFKLVDYFPFFFFYLHVRIERIRILQIYHYLKMENDTFLNEWKIFFIAELIENL